MKNSNFEIWSVINVTPDSFYPGSRTDESSFLDVCRFHLEQGADKLDIGAESTRPQSLPVSFEDEWQRLEKPLIQLKNFLGATEFFNRVSIDTYKSKTARKALELGAGVINDVSGGKDPEMFTTVSEFNASMVLMHSIKTPQTMQDNPQYNDILNEVYDYLSERSETAQKAGIHKNRIIWDFGIGFGKTLDHNLKLLSNVPFFKKSGFPVMAGISRKSFIDKLLDIPDVESRRDPTMIIHTYLGCSQVDILRVHDISETVMIRKILNSLEQPDRFA